MSRNILRLTILVPPGPRRPGPSVYRPVLPRGPLRLGALAEKSRDVVDVIDFYSAPELLETFPREIGASVPDALGLSVHGAPSLAAARGLVHLIDRLFPKIPLFIGGNLAEVAPDLILRSLPLESRPHAAVLQHPTWDTIQDLRKRPYPQDGPHCLRGPSVSSWDPPRLDGLTPDLGFYLDSSDFEYHLETQIGCPFRCFHCGTGREGLYRQVRYRPVESIELELSRLNALCKSRGKPRPSLWITDETFLSGPAHALSVCAALRATPQAWTWRAQTRADTVTVELLKEMQASGCNLLAIGVEIPSDAGLTLLNKQEAMDAVRRAFAACRAVGIPSEAILVLGSPSDNTTLDEILDCMDALGAASVQTYIYHTVPGSPWWHRYGSGLTSGAPDSWSSLDFHSPPIDDDGTSTTTILNFLALSVWSPLSSSPSTDGLNIRLLDAHQLRCSTCRQPYRLSARQAASTCAAWQFTRGHEVRYLAIGPDHALLYTPAGEDANIYASSSGVDSSEVLETLGTSRCPWCLT